MEVLFWMAMGAVLFWVAQKYGERVIAWAFGKVGGH